MIAVDGTISLRKTLPQLALGDRVRAHGNAFRASTCILEEGWDSDGCISLVLCGMEHVFDDSE